MVAGICIAIRLKVPCICEIRDLWPEAIFSFGKVNEKSPFGKMLVTGEHWIYRKANALIFTKEGDTDYLKERGWTDEQGGDIFLRKCHYINNGVDLEAFDYLAESERIEDGDLEREKFRVIYAGILRPVNNVGNILDCAKILADNSEIEFLIYGDGSQRESLEKRIKEEHLTNVKMKGFVERRYIPYILKHSSVNILNYSRSQYNWSRGNSSNKLFEYMASGKPVLSTVKMGYDIIEKYKCGLSLENGTSTELAEAILQIKNMSEEKYQELCDAARNGAENFDFKVLTKKLIDVIESV